MDEDDCSVIPPEGLRMAMVAVAGTFIAVVSLIFNAFLFVLLISNPQYRRTHLLYLAFLALIDTFLSASYILIFPVNLFMDYFESDFLAWAWFNYVKPMLAICHVAITSSALLLTSATFERYLTISKIRSQFSTTFRLIIVMITVLFAVAAKAPMYFELIVVENTNCTGVTGYSAYMAEWSYEEPYQTVYKFWFRNIIGTFLPFFLSLHFNLSIVARLRQQHTGARLFRFATSEHRRNIRAATRMLVLITSTYIVCNSLSVVIAAWEFIDKESLYTSQLRPFYTYATDLVSILTVVACSIRLPIYYFCNRRLRREVNDRLLRFCGCEPEKVEGGFSRKSRLTTIRYLNTGDGFVLSNNGSRRHEPKCIVGTGFDRVVLQVAMQDWSRGMCRGAHL
ncbi:unnamed protein product [Bursaphelenchus okinawaensis]|uniref:G-protein coupled receptors family 1 profile domain-containing protein n=1 Tax=Bursaphelenchus okinawaensis TaxID=465554 RepID=A0A811K9B0_9BILA|nr:unnamed protein product [Bursaphelenchus okinawaensis]CAG9094733.1 unnamed protein product [Bursaphelenchus okinawaensis]